MDNSENQKRIQIIGIGNGGCNIVSNLARQAEDELYVLCDMEEIGVKHTDNCKTVIFDKDILSSPSDSSHLYGQVIEKQADLVFVKESLKAGKRTIGIVHIYSKVTLLINNLIHSFSLTYLK